MITDLLASWPRRDARAESRLFDAAYGGLLQIASRLMRRELPGPTLDPAALVHEAFLRLAVQRPRRWRSRGHFFAVAATTMRRVLCDAGRRRRAFKREAAARALPLEERRVASARPDARIEALRDALGALVDQDPRLAAVVELRFFGGLTIDQVAVVLKRSRTTVVADWRRARAWLASHLAPPGP